MLRNHPRLANQTIVVHELGYNQIRKKLDYRALFFFLFDDFVKHAVILGEMVVSREQIIKLDLTNFITVLRFVVVVYEREVENRRAIVGFDQD